MDDSWSWTGVPGLDESAAYRPDGDRFCVAVVRLSSGTIYVRTVRNALVLTVVAIGEDGTAVRIFDGGLKLEAREAVNRHEQSLIADPKHGAIAMKPVFPPGTEVFVTAAWSRYGVIVHTRSYGPEPDADNPKSYWLSLGRYRLTTPMEFIGAEYVHATLAEALEHAAALDATAIKEAEALIRRIRVRQSVMEDDPQRHVGIVWPPDSDFEQLGSND